MPLPSLFSAASSAASSARLRSILALLLYCGLAVHAADGGKPKPAASGADADKADAAAVFVKQAATAPQPTGTTPAFTGIYLWGGRADITYRPFFQWEFKLQAGTAALTDVRLRLATLGPDRQVLVQGEWKPIGSVNAGKALLGDYRLNCPTMPAYRLELAWTDAGNETTETYLALDKAALPIALSPLANDGWLVAVNALSEIAKDKSTTVSWRVWNLGGAEVVGAIATVNLHDENGKIVKAIELKKEPLTVPGNGVVAQQKQLPANLPKFATMSVALKTPDGTVTSADTGGFSGVADVEVGFLSNKGTTLSGKIRNGLSTDQPGVTLTLTLMDKNGKALTTATVPIGDLAAGAERPFSADLGAKFAWLGYESSWTAARPAPTAKVPPVAKAASAEPATDQPAEKSAEKKADKTSEKPVEKPTVDGLPDAVIAKPLTFTPSKLVRVDGAIVLTGTVVNDGAKDLTPLRLTFTLGDAAHGTQTVEWSAAGLTAGAGATVVVRTTLTDLASIGLSWDRGEQAAR